MLMIGAHCAVTGLISADAVDLVPKNLPMCAVPQ
jgi:hypothetical protein